MASTKEERQLRRALSTSAQQVLELFEACEQESFYAPARVLAALHANQPLQFIAFSCLGTYKDKEELRLDLFETYFLRSRKYGQMQSLLQRIRDHVDAQMLVVLPDCEPVRTWGWSCDQSESTTACELMIEEGRKHIPENWDVATWSSIESRAALHVTHAHAVRWASESAQALHVHQEDQHLRAFPDILFPGGTREAAQRQVAAYAFEGATLERVYPNAIYVQSESPASRKDRMYQPLRTQELPIIHPFTV